MFIFFFSSRRRHTRCLSDWSSDVCSSDLSFNSRLTQGECVPVSMAIRPHGIFSNICFIASGVVATFCRSEERRVGKECRCEWAGCSIKKKEVQVDIQFVAQNYD